MTLMSRTITRPGHRLLLAVVLALTFGGAGTAAAMVSTHAPHSTAPRSSAAHLTSAPARTLPLVVRTDKGAVRGAYAGSAREFLGIPYAAPPTGALRWQPPQPATRWTGIRSATSPGSNCAQTGSLASGVITTSTAEDCLYLNVYTPKAARGHLPDRKSVV